MAGVGPNDPDRLTLLDEVRMNVVKSCQNITAEYCLSFIFAKGTEITDWYILKISVGKGTPYYDGNHPLL